MDFFDYLQEDRIKLHLRATTKKDVILELASLVRTAPEMKDYDGFCQELFRREEVASTGVGCGIALPHARTDTVSKFCMVVGRSDHDIDFQAVDEQPVHLFFLMGIPQCAIKGYLKLLARITRLLKHPNFTQQLLAARTPAELIGTFQETEKHLYHV